MWPGLVIVRSGLLWVATAASVVLLLAVVVMLRLLLVSRSSMMSALALVLWRLLVTGPGTGPRPLGLGVTRGDHTLLGDGLGHRHRGRGLRGAIHRPRRARVTHDDLAGQYLWL